MVVRTERQTNFEDKLRKRTQTSGCAQGTAFGDLMEALESVVFPKTPLRTSWLYRLTHAINTTPSLYLEAGAIHGCVLAREDRPLVYMEDVGRHNAVDKIAGWMFRMGKRRGQDLLHHRPPHLRDGDQDGPDGHPDPGLALRLHGVGRRARPQCGLTLIGRARGKRFVALSGEDRIVFDQDLSYVEDESAKNRRKGAGDEGSGQRTRDE